MSRMVLGVDASNLRAGGGVTHLMELLRAAQPARHGFGQIVVWGAESTLGRLEPRPWLRKVHEPLLDRALPMHVYWRHFVLDRLAAAAGCDVLFVPGGSYSGGFHPFVAMCRNMLPFEWSEARRYGLSLGFLRLVLLRWLQAKTFHMADGVVFLTEYAREGTGRVVKRGMGETVVIPHGINRRFYCSPREQRRIEEYSKDKPFRILYVSTVDVYKHQWHVAKAVASLGDRGYPIQLTLIGPACPPAFRRLKRAMNERAGCNRFVSYAGSVSHAELADSYRRADMFVFASTCENLPNILLEAMASGLPIVCSNRGPMPEVAQDAVLYCDPEDPVDIGEKVETLLRKPGFRAEKAARAHQLAQTYSWDQCAGDTLEFIRRIASPARRWNRNEIHTEVARQEAVSES